MEKIMVLVEEGGERLDRYLSSRLKEFSRSYIQQLINEDQVMINDLPERQNYKVKQGDAIAILIPPSKDDDSIEPENIPLNIIYEDRDIIIINKERGMVVHPAPGNYRGTLVNALKYHCKNLSSINGTLRPGIVHRLDKETSGLMVAAKNDVAHRKLAEDLKERKVKRTYLALVYGNVETERGKIDAPIGRDPKDRKKMAIIHNNSKKAITHFKILERFGDYTLVEAELETGRTHQIRVHLSFIGHPVVGDPKYTQRKNPFRVSGQLLHAKRLKLDHPVTQEEMEFNAVLPTDFQEVLNLLRG